MTRYNFCLLFQKRTDCDRPTLKKAILGECKTDQASLEQAFLSHIKKTSWILSGLFHCFGAIILRCIWYQGRYVTQQAVSDGGYSSVSLTDSSTHFLQIATGLPRQIKPHQAALTNWWTLILYPFLQWASHTCRSYWKCKQIGCTLQWIEWAETPASQAS